MRVLCMKGNFSGVEEDGGRERFVWRTGSLYWETQLVGKVEESRGSCAKV
jgi:hypothetical protein